MSAFAVLSLADAPLWEPMRSRHRVRRFRRHQTRRFTR